ncbi:MAG: protease complex subunit PrcB family protein [Gemmatimonadota bacterium]
MRVPVLLSLLLVAGGLLAACAGRAGDSPLPEGGTDLTVRDLGHWTAGRFDQPARRLIRSASAWAAAWDSLGEGERPAVDFTRETVVLAAAGERRTGGYTLAVAGVRDSAGTLVVTVIERAPGTRCMAVSAITHPATAVAVPVVARPARFVDRREVNECG